MFTKKINIYIGIYDVLKKLFDLKKIPKKSNLLLKILKTNKIKFKTQFLTLFKKKLTQKEYKEENLME